MGSKESSSKFWKELTREVSRAAEVSLITIEKIHLEQTSALMEEDASIWWTIFCRIGEPCPRFYEMLRTLNFHSSQIMVLLDGQGIAPTVSTMVPSPIAFYSCELVLAKILLPVYFANGQIWPLMEDALVENCYQDRIWHYGRQFASLYPDFIKAVSIAESQEYSQGIKGLIEKIGLSFPQVANIAFLTNIFFELVPCKFRPEKREEKPPK